MQYSLLLHLCRFRSLVMMFSSFSPQKLYYSSALIIKSANNNQMDLESRQACKPQNGVKVRAQLVPLLCFLYQFFILTYIRSVVGCGILIDYFPSDEIMKDANVRIVT